MDVLADVLRGLHLRTKVYGRLEMRAPWGMRVDKPGHALFYAVSRGSCLLEVDGARIPLSGGDFVFLLGGSSHVLRDCPGTRPMPVAEIYAIRGGRCGGLVHHGGAGAPTTLVSGCFLFEGTSLDPLIASLPPLIHVKGDGGVAARWLESTLQFVASEMEAEQPGYETVASRLSEVLFVQALRTHVASLPIEQASWLRALTDAQIGVVLQRLHENPEKPWTVESLAHLASMSRSVFAARFKAVVGEGPLTYLTRWRMHRATQLMAGGDRSTTAIAQAVGYETDSAFVKAFKRHLGETPGAFRRRLKAREGDAVPAAGPR
ncbi:AraC family transcriptional regulator [Polyangium jinanense]|uniref:AraC family transcriptional regulator n=1 Tax=Polyangium jinanense TaxID=2829994 RepID=A0A9X3X1X8_9BACT|nr:AraC family transcriptional regulator [Polyangium jinanense]MDC3954485.1 AraC family transcriptional regulator [Polyangium jinanense]MDC3980788.1 AraC family transcriptional regulator [Polyangium jinanense]